MIKLNINLSTIPKERIFQGKKGKYLNIVVSELKQPDAYGNTHSIYIEQTKEEREGKAEKLYIGKGKQLNFSSPAKEQDDDDLPF
jgi:hypothetical protein